MSAVPRKDVHLIDEYEVENTGSFVSFLDVKFTFDANGQLQTDLHVKETDARSYLHFSSSHPNHIFSGIVYSQCLRLRRIINSTERLKTQLDILKDAFLESGYPKKMVDNIAANVLTKERILERKNKSAATTVEATTSEPIRVISSFGSDSDLVNIVQKYEPHLRRTLSFYCYDSYTQAQLSCVHLLMNYRYPLNGASKYV